MEEKKNKVIPYYQFFNCAPQMFKDYQTRCVFEYLFSVWLYRARQGKFGAFKYSQNQISLHANINRRSIPSALAELSRMNLLSLNESNCTLNAKYFFSVVELFNNAKAELREKIKSAFLENDVSTLTQLGLVDCTDEQPIINKLAQGSVSYSELCNLTDAELHNNSQITQPCVNQQMSNYTTLCKSTDAELHNNASEHTDDMGKLHNDVQITQGCVNRHMSNYTGLCNLYLPEKIAGAFWGALEIKDCVKPDALLSKIDDTIQKLDGFAANESDVDTAKLVQTLANLGISLYLLECAQKEENIDPVQITQGCVNRHKSCVILHSSCVNRHKSCANYTTVNKEKKEKEENELGERSEPSNIGGEKQKTKKIEEENEEDDFYEGKDFFEDLEKEENFERQEKDNVEEEGKPFYEGLEIPAQFKDPISESEYYRRDLEKIKKKERTLNNPFLNKPYFSEKDIKRITSSIGLQEEAVKSPVKLFYYNFWWGLYDWYQEENEEDVPANEYGESPEEEEEQNDLNMLGSFVPVEETFKQIERAWRLTEDNVKAGFIELEDETVKVEIKELPDINPMFLIDWRVTKDINKEDVFVISLEGFRNIEAKDATEVRKPKTKEEVKAFNRKNRQFIATVMNMEDSQLTPMERAAKTFARDFLRMDEYYHVEGFMNGRGYPMMENLLPGYLLKPWALKISNELEVSQEDFYKTLNQRGGYKDGANLSFMATTFDYQEVKRWNEMNGFQSRINEETLKNAV